MPQPEVTPLQRLTKVLKLGTPSTYRDHTYVNGESLYFPTGRVYGGQVIAQSLIAASKTVDPSRLPNSIHGYFISAGDIHQDLLFDVENLRDGRSFSARRVNVTQAQGSILTAIASFQEHGQEGVEFADPMPEDVPDPETLTSAKEIMEPTRSSRRMPSIMRRSRRSTSGTLRRPSCWGPIRRVPAGIPASRWFG